MALLKKISPPKTPLDALRAKLAGPVGDNAEFQLQITHLLQTLRKQALRVLGPWLSQEGVPNSLRRKLLGMVPKFDWPAWAAPIHSALKAEKDLGVFDDGAQALGTIGTKEAYLALRELQVSKPSPDHQIILTRELGAFSSTHSFQFFLGRLQEGAGNPKLAAQAAKLLSVLADCEHLPLLAEVFEAGDDLVRKLVLRIIAGIEEDIATQWLKALALQSSESIADHLALLEILRKTANCNRGSAKEDFVRIAGEHFAGRCPESLNNRISGVRSGGEINIRSLLEPFTQIANGATDAFLLESLELLLEGKMARFTAFHAEAQESAEEHFKRWNFALDEVADHLAYRAERGLAPMDDVAPVLSVAFQKHQGSDLFLQAFLSVIPPDSTQILDEILADPDIQRRQKCFNAIGNREDDAFTPFFLKALNDPIVEMSQLAMHHLGKLPSALTVLMALFESDQPDRMRKAIHAFGENQIAQAAPALVAFLRKDMNDQLMVEAVEALAQIRYPEAVPTLLQLLHDGKPLSLQIALCHALGLMETPEASLGLLLKAPHLKHSQVIMLCLEGTLTAFPSFEAPLPLEQLPLLLELVDRCWDLRQGEGQRLPTLMVMQNLFTMDKSIYEKLKNRFSDFLTEMRTRETWDKSQNEAVAAVLKELGRRSVALGQLAKKEFELQNAMQQIPAKGPKRAEGLLALREMLKDEELILRPDLAVALGGFVFSEIYREGNEWKELALLCEMAGLCHQTSLIEAIQETYFRATGLGLKSAAKEALLRLGVPEAELQRRLPIRTILVLEPSAFFRKKILSSLAATGRWKLFEAADRKEAQAILDMDIVDLLLTEIHDTEGDLSPWIDSQWNDAHCKRILLSSSSRNLGDLPNAVWYEETFFKPYPMERLLQLIGADSPNEPSPK